VLVRITNMRGADLNVFEFDYDLTWAAFFMNGHGHVYGRFGGRDAKSPDSYLTLSGLKYAMRAAVAAPQAEPAKKPKAAKAPRSIEQLPAAKRFEADACLHCHQVYDFRREEKQGAGTWRLDDVWEYPMPDSLGIVLDPDQGNLIKSVKSGSPAGRAGIRAGDVLTTTNGQATASFADVQYGLHLAKNVKSLGVEFQRDGKSEAAAIALAADWRQTDIGWRASMWGLRPDPNVHGQDLSAREKRELGLPEDGMAFRQGDYVPGPAKAAGIKAGDIIFGIDGKKRDLTMIQFNAFVRLNFKRGDQITFNVLRDGKRIDLPMTLPTKDH
jgi:membrane-associated protease RseP (regulator of RpoE activity)